ncbi:MAG: MFS transporter [Hyphomicrobiales bacterium]|nr:MFS transporter [Hyphomicrobiales bacterium]
MSEADSIRHHPPFVLYWSARACASMGFQMLGVAVGWQMYELTGSAFDLGLVGLVQFLPAAALMMVAGQIADRYDRRRLLQIFQTVEASAAALLAIAAQLGFASKELLLTAVLIFGIGRAFDSPTQQTLLPAVVPPKLFPSAVAASSSTTQLATIAGPALGGFLYVLGATIPYTICCLLYLSSVTMLTFLKTAPFVPSRAPINLAAFFAGVSYIRHNPIVLGVISLDLFAVLLGGTTALLPIFASEVLGSGSEGLGLLRAAPAIGALTVMIALTRKPLTRRVGRIMFVSVACFGLATVVFALSRSFALSMLALAVLGASDAVSVVIRMTLVQIETPDEMRGRVNAVNSLFAGTSNQLGDFRAGTMAAWLGAVPAVLVGGVGILLVVLAWTRMFPALAKVESFHFKKA